MEEAKEIEETTTYGDTFITYRSHRIFFKWKPQHLTYFAIVYKVGNRPSGDYPCIGCEWLPTKEEAISWGKRVIDEYLG